jgi:uncharacterized membrane protein YeaQ/YmgE (transglycosylase-associated protein family)
MQGFLTNILAIIIYIAIGAIIAYLFYYIKRRDLFGGYIGGLVIGLLGALIGGLLLNDITERVFNFLLNVGSANAIAGFIGAYIALHIMNKLSHDRERKKY